MCLTWVIVWTELITCDYAFCNRPVGERRSTADYSIPSWQHRYIRQFIIVTNFRKSCNRMSRDDTRQHVLKNFCLRVSSEISNVIENYKCSILSSEQNISLDKNHFKNDEKFYDFHMYRILHIYSRSWKLGCRNTYWVTSI